MTRDTDERGKLDTYIKDWARIIWDATGDQTKVDRAILLADLNGMFDPAKFAAARAPAGHAEREALDNLLDAARLMPRTTPKPGGASTVHDYKIEAAYVWGLDRMCKAAEAALSNAPAPSEGVREPDAWEWRACIGGRWGAWLYLDQPIDRFRERSAFNLANGTYELRPLYAGPTALTTPADTEDQGPDTLGERP